MKESKGCKSPEHQPNCPCMVCSKPVENCHKCPQLSTQHEIPKSIGRKILGMSNKELDEYTHKESKPCHRENDVRIPEVFNEMARMKRKGNIFTKEGVIALRKFGIFKG